MTEAQAIEAVLEQWKSAWEALHPASTSDPQCVPWTTRNESFTADQLGALGAWTRIAVIHTIANQISVGSAPGRRFERRGNIFVQLFAPVDSGVALLATLAGDVRSVLEARGMTVSGAEALHTFGARTEEQPEDGTWAMSVVVIPFRYVDTR